MHDLQAVTIVVILRERLLLIRSTAGVLGLDEANVARLPSDSLQVIEDVLHEQFAYVLADLQLKLRILLAQNRQNDLGNDALGCRHEMQTANPCQVGLDE